MGRGVGVFSRLFFFRGIRVEVFFMGLQYLRKVIEIFSRLKNISRGLLF